MQSLMIRGGRPLAGEIRISGSKNAVLPMLAASVMFRDGCCIRSCPNLTDVDAEVEILKYLGAEIDRIGDQIAVDARKLDQWEIPFELMNKMRGSVFFAGALMARTGSCHLEKPGGCALGNRPVDFHIAGLKALGAQETEPGVFHGGLVGGSYTLPYPSVGATENLLMAALGADGPSRILNAAREPEIVCLCDFLRQGGCRISGDGTSVIHILPGLPEQAEMEPIPDRMEAATFACALASATGDIRLNHVIHSHLSAVLDALEQAGCVILRGDTSVEVRCNGLVSPGEIVTGPYPQFPTDAQAPFLAAMLRAEGITRVTETVFSDRMKHIAGLRALGAEIKCLGNSACVCGVEKLCGATVRAEDLRGGASLAVAALAAEGETKIDGLHHLMRGYERFADKLCMLGGDAALV